MDKNKNIKLKKSDSHKKRKLDFVIIKGSAGIDC